MPVGVFAQLCVCTGVARISELRLVMLIVSCFPSFGQAPMLKLVEAAVEAVAEVAAELTEALTEAAAPVGSCDMLKLVAPVPKKKRRSAAAIAPSISGTACPPSCHSQLVRSAEHVQRRYCDRLGHLEVHACGKKLPLRAAKVDEESERRRARRHCGRDERAVGDAADAAYRSVLLDPAFHVSHALANCSGAACLVHRCRLPAKVAGAVVLSRCSEACEQLGRWAHGMRRVEELYLKAVRSEFGQPAGELKYPAHQRAVPCLAVQHEQPAGGRVEQAAGSRTT
eukprot:scaffold1456_cov68-Phaeocystis_antarctica.AAC.2